MSSTTIKKKVGICSCGGTKCGIKTPTTLTEKMSWVCYWKSRSKTVVQKPRAPIKSSRKPINKFSTKTKLLMDQYYAALPEWKKNNPLCLAKLPGCTIHTQDCHHKEGRGKNLLIQSKWLPVCRSCHDRIGRKPKEALSLGLIILKTSN